MQGLQRAGIAEKLNVLSMNTVDDVTFVSSMESTKYPFYGVQFHPEKNLYEWVNGKKIPHNMQAVLVTQYFANFFVNEGLYSSLNGGSMKYRNHKILID